MNNYEIIKNALENSTATIDTYNKKLVDFETNIMLFDDANIIKNINELSLMRTSLNDNIVKLLNTTKAIGCNLEQYCLNNGLEYEFNEFTVQKRIMQDLLDSLDKTNNQINECVASVLKTEQPTSELPTSIRRRTRQAKLKKSK